MLTDLDTDDWREAFRFALAPSIACPHVAGHAGGDHACAAISTAPFDRASVGTIFALLEGRPPHAGWLGVFKLADGRFAALRARCCGDGWRCHAEGAASVAATLADVLRYGLTDAERALAGLAP